MAYQPITQFDEDSVHVSGDRGIQLLSVRNDVLATLAGTDGDYAPLQVNASGALFIQEGSALDVSAATVTVDLGANNDVTLNANSGVDIGDVDILSIIPGTGATNLGKAVDAVAGGTDTGIASLAIRDDTLTTLTPADGDYVPLRVNSTGALHITGAAAGTEFNVDSVAGGTDAGTAMLVIRDDTLTTLTPVDGDYVRLRVNSTGALHVTGGGGGTEYTEDEVSANPIIGTATIMERDDILATVTPIEGDNIALRGTAEGALWVQDFNSDAIRTAVELIDNAISGNEMQVDVVASLPAGTNNIGDIDVLSVPAPLDVTGGGTEVSALRVTIANNSTGVLSIDDNGGAITVDNAGTFAVQIVDTSFAVADGNALGEGVLIQGDDGTDRKNINVDATTGDVQVDVTNTVTVDLGANNDVILNANSGVDIGDVDILSIAAGSNLIGDVGLQPRTSGGLSRFKSIDLDETEEEIKATAGQVYSIAAFNLTAAPLFLKLYNATAANVTVGTTTPDETYVIPANADSDGAGFTISFPQGVAFGTAITAACTTGVADNDSGAPAANACVVMIHFS